MEDTEEIRLLLSDLISLSGRSASAIAVSAGLTKSGLLRFLKGHKESLGPLAIFKIVGSLGIESGHLSARLVHFFEVGEDEGPIQRVLSREGGDFEMVYIAPKSMAAKDFITLGVANPLFLCSPSVRIVIAQPSPFSGPIHERLDGLARWRPGVLPDSYFKNPTIRVDRDDFDSICGKKTGAEDYDRILSLSEKGKRIEQAGELTWQDLTDRLSREGWTPETVLAQCTRRSGKSGK